MTNHPDQNIEICLAQQVAAGDERAFRDFYERFADPLYQFIFHQMDGIKEDAEEVWQDTLMAAVHGIGGYRGESRLFSWLCAIARRKAADFFRKTGRAAPTLSIDGGGDLELADGGPLPEDVLADRAVRARVVEALECLPQDYRAALSARYLRDVGIAEIALNLGKSYKATESLLARARGAFKTAFERSGE